MKIYCITQGTQTGALWQPREVGWGGREVQEGGDICAFMDVLMHIDAWQKPTQYCEAIILQLKINKFFKMFSSSKMQKELQKLKTTKVNNKSKEQLLNGF